MPGPASQSLALNLDAQIAGLQDMVLRATRDGGRAADPSGAVTAFLGAGRAAHRITSELASACRRWGAVASDIRLLRLLRRVEDDAGGALQRLEYVFSTLRQGVRTGGPALRPPVIALLGGDPTEADEALLVPLLRWSLHQTTARAVQFRVLAVACGEHLAARLQDMTVNEALVTGRLLAAYAAGIAPTGPVTPFYGPPANDAGRVAPPRDDTP